MATVAVSSKSISGFDPRSAIPGCQLWLDAADSSTLTLSGSNVTKWTDKSINGYSLTPNSTNPTYSSNGVVFNSSYLNTSNNVPTSKIGGTNGNTFTTFIVANITSSTGVPILYEDTTVANDGGTLYFLYYSSGTSILFDSGTLQNPRTSATSPSNLSNTSVVRIARNSTTNYDIYYNGYLLTTTVSGNQNNLSSISGSIIVGRNSMVGTIYEILHYNTYLTTSQCQQLEGYLAAKWGLQSQLNKYFSPTSIPTCSLWLDAADPSTISYFSGTGYISQWNDKSGYGGTLTTNYYYYSGYALFNNLPSILTGSPDQTGRLSGNFGSIPASSNYTIFIALNFNSASGSSARLCGFAPNSGYKEDYIDGFPIYTNSANSPIVFTYGTYASSATISPNSFTSNTGPAIITINVTCSSSLTLSYWGFGTRPVGGATANGNTIGANWFEMLVYNSALTTAQQTQIQSYLGKKWGITTSNVVLPKTHPYYFVQPYTRVFQPTDIGGCQLWLDAGDVSSLTLSGSNVTAWNDKSGNANNFAQSTSSAQPTYVSNSLSFNGTSNYLYQSNSSQYILNNLSAWTIFSVQKINTSAGGVQQVYRSGNGLLYRYFSVYQFYNGGTQYVNVSGSGDGIATSVVANGTATGYINGVSQGTGDQTSSTGQYTFTLGANASPAEFLNGYIYEIIMFNFALTNQQRQQVEGYLAWKWGLTGQISSFSPTSISGCSLWLDAADTSSSSMTFSSGSNLSVWKDKSGNTNNFSTTSGTTSNISDGGYSVVSFPSGAVMTSTNKITFTTSSAFFIVSKLTTNSGITMLLGFSDINPSGNVGDFSIRFTSANLVGTPVSSGGPGELGNNNYYTNGTFNPSFGSSYYYNVYSIIDTVTPVQSGTSTITLSSSFYSRYFVGNIAEVIYYAGGVTSSQRQQIESYLSKKWGVTVTNYLPPSHPYRALPPTNVLFSPISIPGISLWLDAGDSSTIILNGSNVTQWNDKSGRSLCAVSNTNYSGLSLPTYNSSGTQYIQFADSQALIVNNWGYTPGWSCFVAMNTVSLNNRWLISPFSNVSLVMMGMNVGGDKIWTNRLPSAGSDATGNHIENTNAVNTNSNALLSWYRDGTLQTNNTTNPGVALNSTCPLGIGGNATFNDARGGTYNIYEIIIYNTYLPDSQRQQVEGYLAKKWGLLGNLPTTHPYYKTAPSSIPNFAPVQFLPSSATNNDNLSYYTNSNTFNGHSGQYGDPSLTFDNNIYTAWSPNIDSYGGNFTPYTLTYTFANTVLVGRVRIRCLYETNSVHTPTGFTIINSATNAQLFTNSNLSYSLYTPDSDLTTMYIDCSFSQTSVNGIKLVIGKTTQYQIIIFEVQFFSF